MVFRFSILLYQTHAGRGGSSGLPCRSIGENEKKFRIFDFFQLWSTMISVLVEVLVNLALKFTAIHLASAEAELKNPYLARGVMLKYYSSYRQYAHWTAFS